MSIFARNGNGEATKAYAAQLYSFAIVISFIAVLFILLLRPVAVQPELRDILNIVLGVLLSELKSVGGYYIGSSQSSRNKDEILGTVLKNNAATTSQLTDRVINTVVTNGTNGTPKDMSVVQNISDIANNTDNIVKTTIDNQDTLDVLVKDVKDNKSNLDVLVKDAKDNDNKG